jgi:hypothetical protein
MPPSLPCPHPADCPPPCRSPAELFDWLRALPRDHQLSKLADLYTYTTLISQVRHIIWRHVPSQSY